MEDHGDKIVAGGPEGGAHGHHIEAVCALKLLYGSKCVVVPSLRGGGPQRQLQGRPSEPMLGFEMMLGSDERMDGDK